MRPGLGTRLLHFVEVMSVYHFGLYIFSICNVIMVTGTVAHFNGPEKPYLQLAWIARPLTSQHMAACTSVITQQEGWSVSTSAERIIEEIQ